MLLLDPFYFIHITLQEKMSYSSYQVSLMVIYMSGNAPYNEVEVMYSEQSARFICLEGSDRTEAAAFDAEETCRTTPHERPHNHRFGDLQK